MRAARAHTHPGPAHRRPAGCRDPGRPDPGAPRGRGGAPCQRPHPYARAESGAGGREDIAGHRLNAYRHPYAGPDPLRDHRGGTLAHGRGHRDLRRDGARGHAGPSGHREGGARLRRCRRLNVWGRVAPGRARTADGWPRRQLHPDWTRPMAAGRSQLPRPDGQVRRVDRPYGNALFAD